jgi:hypothetical protein
LPAGDNYVEADQTWSSHPVQTADHGCARAVSQLPAQPCPDAAQRFELEGNQKLSH